jgi:hypothetical protein
MRINRSTLKINPNTAINLAFVGLHSNLRNAAYQPREIGFNNRDARDISNKGYEKQKQTDFNRFNFSKIKFSKFYIFVY